MAKQRPGYGPPAPVAVFQWAAEFTELLALYKERAPMRVLEVGTYHGGTLYHWLTHAPKGAKVVSLDSYAVGVDNRDQYPRWCPKGVKLVALEGDSSLAETAAKVKRHGPFDWVWIDAGHRYEEVRRDWELYGPMCRTGGVVCFHDILPASRHHPEIEVSRLWDELKAEHETREIVADWGAQWGGIGVLYR